LVVAVDKPYGPKHAMALATGLFVGVDLKGKTMAEVVAIPHGALRDGTTVWLMDRDNKLKIKPVTVMRKGREYVYLDGGLAPGDRIILTSLAGAADGMLLRLAVDN
jgi:hypothetical protein